MIKRPPVAQRIAAAREATGMTHSVVAARLGLSVPAYSDLETNDDEAFVAITLGELVALATTLKVSPRGLVDSGDPLSSEPVSFSQLAEAIRQRILSAGGDIDRWGEVVGWDVSEVLTDSQRTADLSLDCLVDVCTAVDLDWRAVVPL